MQSLRCLRPAASGAASLLRTAAAPTVFSPLSSSISTRTFTLLSLRRPQLGLFPLSNNNNNTNMLPTPGILCTSSSPSGGASAIALLDLQPKPSAHPALASLQVRCGPRDTYDPSHRVRKRRFGFLARNRTRGGRAVLKRRRLKGRHALSH